MCVQRSVLLSKMGKFFYWGGGWKSKMGTRGPAEIAVRTEERWRKRRWECGKMG